MIHNVKEAKEKAFKTVERYASKKNNCLNFFEPFMFRRASSLLKMSGELSNKKNMKNMLFLYIIEKVMRKIEKLRRLASEQQV